MGVKWTWTDIIPGVVTGLLFINCSRKFGFGLWVFFATNYMAAKRIITAGDWATGMFLASLLIGGGTIADALLGWIKVRFGGSGASAPRAE